MRCESRETAARVARAPIVHSPDPLSISRGRKSRPISVSTSNCLRLSLGYRSVPPATNIARGPSSAAMRAASRADFGRRYLNLGNRNIWRLDLDQRGIGDRREARWAEARGLALLLAAEGLDDLLRRHRR